MIQANELRIGNIVMYHGDTDMECVLDAQDILNISTNYMFNAELHSPIPLTEEWLLMFGFEVVQDGWYMFEKTPISFTWNIYDCFLRALGYSFPQIKHVHQLQNLYFALTGEELKQKEG